MPNYTQDAPRWAYSSYPSGFTSRETKADKFQRYSSLYKMFNNRRRYGEMSSGADSVSQQVPLYSQKQSLASKKKGVPQKVRFAEQDEVIGQQKKEAEAVVEEKNIDAAADGFISWKRRSLQMSRTFKDE